jgi:hypothetical protein
MCQGHCWANHSRLVHIPSSLCGSAALPVLRVRSSKQMDNHWAQHSSKHNSSNDISNWPQADFANKHGRWRKYIPPFESLGSCPPCYGDLTSCSHVHRRARISELTTFSGGWGPVFLIVLLPAQIFVLVRNSRSSEYVSFVCATWLAMFLIVQFYYPGFTLFVFALSAVALSIAMEEINGRWAGAISLIAILAACAVLGLRASAFSRQHIGVRQWSQFLRLDNRWDKALFLTQWPSVDTARAIHVGRLGHDVVYTTSIPKYYFAALDCKNKVVPIFYDSGQDLLRNIVKYSLKDPAIVTERGSTQEKALRTSTQFSCVYTNNQECIFKLIGQPVTATRMGDVKNDGAESGVDHD